MRRSSRTPWAGPARLGGYSPPGTGVSNPGHYQARLPPTLTREAPCVPREFASGLASFLLPPPASGAGSGDSRLRKEPPFESGGRPRPGRLAHPGLGAHGASSAVDLQSPPQRPMLDVGFSFPFGVMTDCLFSPSASPLDGQRRAGPGLGISAPSLWRGSASPSDLCSAAAFYAVQLPCS